MILRHQVAAILTLTIVSRKDDTRTEFVTIPLIFVTGLLLAFWRFLPLLTTLVNQTPTIVKIISITLSCLVFALQNTYAVNPCGI